MLMAKSKKGMEGPEKVKINNHDNNEEHIHLKDWGV